MKTEIVYIAFERIWRMALYLEGEVVFQNYASLEALAEDFPDESRELMWKRAVENRGPVQGVQGIQGPRGSLERDDITRSTRSARFSEVKDKPYSIRSIYHRGKL